MDPRLPVLVGLGEVVLRPGEGDDAAAEPSALAAEAVRRAVADSGAGQALLDRVQVVAGIPSAAWVDGDPGRRIADLLDLGPDVRTMRSSLQGGNGPQLCVNALAQRIQDGALDCAVVAGAEALSTAMAALKAGRVPDWPAADPARQAGEILEGEGAPPNTEEETAVGLIAPIMVYPLLEHAIRLAAGRTVDAQLWLIAGLWSRFSDVAAGQPCAWSRDRVTMEELRTPSAANRRVTSPYTKLLNSNITVDQGAAVVVCSVEVAQALGVPRDRWVFLHAGAHAADEWFVSERHELHRSPAIEACAASVFAHAGCDVDDLGPIDLYSCFPSAVQLAAQALGLGIDDPSRSLTCTGGLTFFGGPGNNYATHGIAAVGRALREGHGGSLGLATALGWYATKHAWGVYGNRPPSRPFAAGGAAFERPAPRVVAAPGEHKGVAETGTVIYERDGSPSYGILFARLDDGRRALGHSRDRDVLEALAGDDLLGGRVRLAADRSFEAA